MSGGRRDGRSVFVGNIPYDATEEHLRELFAEVGEVVSFRLMMDKDTGRPKGFGFCEYKDLSAIRNLKGREFMNRKLNVDYASDKQRADAQRSGPDAKNGGSLLRPGPAGRQGMGGDQSSGPALHGQEAPAGQAATSIAKTIASMPPQQMFELMKDIKGLVSSQREEARQLLTQQPQLTFALLEALLKMNLVDKATAEKLVAAGGSLSQPPQQPMRGQPPMHHGAAPMDLSMGGPPRPAGGPVPEQRTAEQAALVQQVMSLTEAQIRALPPEQARMLMEVRRRLTNQQ